MSESLLGVIAQGLVKTTDGKRAAHHDILINADACKDYIHCGRSMRWRKSWNAADSMGWRPQINRCWPWWRLIALTAIKRWPLASSPTSWLRLCGAEADQPPLNTRTKRTTAIPADRPIIARRPFQISACGVKPRFQAFSSSASTGSGGSDLVSGWSTTQRPNSAFKPKRLS